MAELELETIERAVRWCAEAGRQTTPGEVRAALGSLGWDQLLAVRALLADPPPARPLGPHALADLSRGVPADLAAERERQERYPRPGPASPAAGAAPPPPSTARAAPPRKRGGPRSRRAQVVVRKAVAARPGAAPEPPRLPLFEELLLPAGRGELERLIRRHGGRRPRLVAAIAATHRRADGLPPGDAELDAALEHHGLDRAFIRRERDELVHAVRAAGAVLARAAVALGHDRASLAAAIARLALAADVEGLREARRRDLRSRATLSERALLLVGSADLLADLELLEEFERDLKQRLPGHLRALSGGGEPLALRLARSLSLEGAAVRALLARLGLELGVPVAVTAPSAPEGAPGRHRQPARVQPGGPPRPPPGDRVRGRRPAVAPARGGRTPSAPASRGRPSGSRPAHPRSTRERPAGPPRSGRSRPRPGGGRRGPTR